MQPREGEYLLKVIAPGGKIDPKIFEEDLGVTGREAEVLTWVAYGKTNKEIAEVLDISVRTVNKHLEQLYAKIGADNRTAAAMIAIQCVFSRQIG